MNFLPYPGKRNSYSGSRSRPGSARGRGWLVPYTSPMSDTDALAEKFSGPPLSSKIIFLADKSITRKIPERFEKMASPTTAELIIIDNPGHRCDCNYRSKQPGRYSTMNPNEVSVVAVITNPLPWKEYGFFLLNQSKISKI
jgi:hypothetical protein